MNRKLKISQADKDAIRSFMRDQLREHGPEGCKDRLEDWAVDFADAYRLDREDTFHMMNTLVWLHEQRSM